MKTVARISIVIIIFFILFTVLPNSIFLTARAESNGVDVIIGFTSKPDVDLIKKNGGEVKNTYTIINAVHALLPGTTVGALESNGKIAYIHENGNVQALPQTIPWGILRVNATISWPLSKGTSIKVAVLDTGVDEDHVDLFSNIAGGFNFVGNNSNYSDDHGHGTHVAGTIAALDNTIGVVGVAPEAKIYAVKMLNSAGSGTIDQAVQAIEWSVTNGMRILSMSWGTTYDFPALHSAVDAAYANGLLLIAAAGNRGSGADTVIYPAKYDTVMAVAATDQSNVKASFSNTGPTVEISAPGVSIYSTYLYNGYAYMDGTSMATPHVSGVAALVWARNPSLTNTQVRQILQNTAIDLGTSGRDNWYGYGLVNAYAAVSAAGQYYVGGAEFKSSPVEGFNTLFAIIVMALTVTLGRKLIKT